MRSLALIGLGLIGGSVARAARERSLVETIRAHDPDAVQTAAGRELGFVDTVCDSIAEAVRDAELVLVAVPVAESAEVIRAVLAAAPAATITDVGSTKGSVLRDIRATLGRVPTGFVPGHPIAGTERSGAVHADAGLFDGRRVILTPLDDTDADARERVTAFWRALGAQVVCMDAERHDRVLGATSHLPHLLAYALVDQLATLDAREEIFAFAAGGFRDFTRIASSSPRMWHDIARANREALIGLIDGFGGQLDALRTALRDDDGEALMACFERARSARARYLDLIESPAETSP